MWVTGNMASNISLGKKGRKKEEEEGKRERKHSYYQHTCYYMHYPIALLNSLLIQTQAFVSFPFLTVTYAGNPIKTQIIICKRDLFETSITFIDVFINQDA